MIVLRPEWLWIAAVLAIIAFWLRIQSSTGHWHQLMSSPLLSFLTASRSSEKLLLNRYLFVASGVAVALSGPAIPDEQSQGYQQLEAWVLALDLSQSMDATDVQPTRLIAASEQLQVIAGQAGARAVAVIGYAGDAFLLTPFSTQLTQLTKLLPGIDSATLGITGSRTERALSLAAELLRNNQIPNGRVILFTDADEVSEAAIKIADRLQHAGQTLDVVVFATDAGGRIPGVADSPRFTPDLSGAETLAAQGGGNLVRSDRLGRLPEQYLERLKSQLVPQDLNLLATQPVGWRDLSHWILLLLTLPLLWLFRRQVG